MTALKPVDLVRTVPPYSNVNFVVRKVKHGEFPAYVTWDRNKAVVTIVEEAERKYLVEPLVAKIEDIGWAQFVSRLLLLFHEVGHIAYDANYFYKLALRILERRKAKEGFQGDVKPLARSITNIVHDVLVNEMAISAIARAGMALGSLETFSLLFAASIFAIDALQASGAVTRETLPKFLEKLGVMEEKIVEIMKILYSDMDTWRKFIEITKKAAESAELRETEMVTDLVVRSATKGGEESVDATNEEFELGKPSGPLAGIHLELDEILSSAKDTNIPLCVPLIEAVQEVSHALEGDVVYSISSPRPGEESIKRSIVEYMSKQGLDASYIEGIKLYGFKKVGKFDKVYVVADTSSSMRDLLGDVLKEIVAILEANEIETIVLIPFSDKASKYELENPSYEELVSIIEKGAGGTTYLLPALELVDDDNSPIIVISDGAWADEDEAIARLSEMAQIRQVILILMLDSLTHDYRSLASKGIRVMISVKGDGCFEV